MAHRVLKKDTSEFVHFLLSFSLILNECEVILFSFLHFDLILFLSFCNFYNRSKIRGEEHYLYLYMTLLMSPLTIFIFLLAFWCFTRYATR